MEYSVVVATNIRDLFRGVNDLNDLIEVRWKPFGGLAVMKTTAVTEKYVQAMIKDE